MLARTTAWYCLKSPWPLTNGCPHSHPPQPACALRRGGGEHVLVELRCQRAREDRLPLPRVRDPLHEPLDGPVHHVPVGVHVLAVRRPGSVRRYRLGGGLPPLPQQRGLAHPAHSAHMEQEVRRVVLRLGVLRQVLGEQGALGSPSDELRLRTLPYELTSRPPPAPCPRHGFTPCPACTRRRRPRP
ncbi:hypothetical protein ACFV7R_23000 [Streptomyces sp. NPDC059866]|uniref:hypothetical protein n=1 Tax=Streptomyces sp. NPDC059866 TaxID=3346978 RepID=UPI003669166F